VFEQGNNKAALYLAKSLWRGRHRDLSQPAARYVRGHYVERLRLAWAYASRIQLRLIHSTEIRRTRRFMIQFGVWAGTTQLHNERKKD